MNPINSFGNLVQKAFYLGMGLASLAGEKASDTLGELRVQATKLADELVARGEMTTEEARRFVDELVGQAQQKDSVRNEENPDPKLNYPRTIEIDDIDESQDPEVEALKAKVRSLREELKKLQS
ncbi:MAG: hypothetical protein SFT94_05205 [Pseudanabaenaceae cyanobacterium bins.68]|nr:hypothetical protein [Pseudanabaenaceae cyanobacterium bins.68]